MEVDGREGWRQASFRKVEGWLAYLDSWWRDIISQVQKLIKNMPDKLRFQQIDKQFPFIIIDSFSLACSTTMAQQQLQLILSLVIKTKASVNVVPGCRCGLSAEGCV